MTVLFGPHSLQRGSLLQALNCVCPKTLEGQGTHQTLLNNVISENSCKAGVGKTVISRVIFSIFMCYWALLLSSCFLLKGLFVIVVSFPLYPFSLSLTLPYFHSISCVSLPQSLRRLCPPHPLSWLMFRGTLDISCSVRVWDIFCGHSQCLNTNKPIRFMLMNPANWWLYKSTSSSDTSLLPSIGLFEGNKMKWVIDLFGLLFMFNPSFSIIKPHCLLSSSSTHI